MYYICGMGILNFFRRKPKYDVEEIESSILDSIDRQYAFEFCTGQRNFIEPEIAKRMLRSGAFTLDMYESNKRTALSYVDADKREMVRAMYDDLDFIKLTIN